MGWEEDVLGRADVETEGLAYWLLTTVYVLYLGIGVASRVRYEEGPWWVAASLGLAVGGVTLGLLWRLGGTRRLFSVRGTPDN